MKPRFNRGWFLRGKDPRRHALTTEERRRGGLKSAALQSCRWAAETGQRHQRNLHRSMIGADAEDDIWHNAESSRR